MSIFTGGERPSLKYLFKYVKEPIAPIWFDFGLELLDEHFEDKLLIIEKNHVKENEEACGKMLKLWHRNDKRASWNKLIKALEERHINKIPLADKIKQMLRSDGMFIIKEN